MLQRYNDKFQIYIDRGVIVPISSQEIAEYCGPRNYITHFGVEQPGSVTKVEIGVSFQFEKWILEFE